VSSPSPAAESPPAACPRWRLTTVAERLIGLALALLLLRSAFAHLGNPYYFLSTVYSYRLTGIETDKWVAVVLPYLQLVLGVCLLARWWAPQAYLLAGLLFAGFVVAQALVLRQGLDIPCGCFGVSDGLSVGWRTQAVAGAAAAFSLLGLALALVSRRSPAANGGPVPCAATPDAGVSR
jgi:Methylamine utilisation protein MauE